MACRVPANQRFRSRRDSAAAAHGWSAARSTAAGCGQGSLLKGDFAPLKSTSVCEAGVVFEMTRPTLRPLGKCK
jgi:hypothetical protein